MLFLLSTSNINVKLIFLFLEIVCYGIGIYKVNRGKDE